MLQSLVSPELANAADILVRDHFAVQSGEEMLITADTASDGRLVTAVMNAATALGAHASVLMIPQLPYQGGLADPWVPEPLASAIQSCDVWFDFTFPYLAGSHAYDAAMETKRVRHLLGGDVGAPGVVRLIGNVDLDHLFAVHHAFDAVVAKAIGRSCRFTTEAGTDVTFTLAKPAYQKPRYADKPGFYVMPGLVTMFPEPDSVRGTLVLEAAFHEWYAPLHQPITLGVDGKIREVSGGGNALEVMDRALRRAGGGEYGSVIHFTCGIHPAARPTGNSFIEDSRVIGSDAVGLGIPWWLPGGGENHPDAVITMQSIWIDGEEIVRRGKIVGPPELARLAADLRPRVWPPAADRGHAR
ncbi:MAG: hypothetical protein AB7V27_05820 [Candidatus Binatia bacterium]